MKTRSISTFKYNFRAPGSQVEGPIRFAVGQTVLGKVIVGRSQRGICAIFLGDEAQALRDQLAAEFPTVELKADQASLERELNQVIAFIDKDQSEGVINLDIGGTAFEQKVWQALCGIPSGKTRSYGDVARDLGVPEAVRAVAGACAANVLAIVIPCHRVVRSDGSISGYRWGVERKRALLADEAVEEAVEFAA
ncbi:methylated-DNA-[]-cysteine S-methyltransferase family protein [Burkholderia pseudomallei TSV 25]|uniref:methylated-DNA--[protein]-cysteine S-methyltransferase n=1 Tax=Burkholderia pseudomallei TaxID=28450 RepID=UPI00050F822B|nr:methylated-DNA--[protein]-cysteine S-methyltransferase [Burkholderia pseudomallei]AIV48973.1 methylated-DNA--[]-cysteine S-methyltransferase family protein [Burkholderia pseudomallei TSV 48]KGC35578.1 methylated-DNA-[]-cysteine S-methyltransferase family protein [Burkholderia pseudomallei]KGW09839.1 methylated-DNA-[]-cysteine S-methyltransferase family protein [Burkholderia pseudomallei TSV 25]KIX58635.1 cysteine methyltransferase [Burkholderia pseudomallei]